MGKHTTSALVGLEEADLVRLMSDVSDDGEMYNLEGEDLTLAQVCVGPKLVEEKLEQPPPLYHQRITWGAQAWEVKLPAEQGWRASRFVEEEAGQPCSFSVPLLPDLEELVLRQLA